MLCLFLHDSADHQLFGYFALKIYTGTMARAHPQEVTIISEAKAEPIKAPSPEKQRGIQFNGKSDDLSARSSSQRAGTNRRVLIH